MRHLIYILLCLPVFVWGQKDLTLDTTWITNTGGQFYENHIFRYSTGEEDGGYKRLIGDTTTTYRKYTERLEQRAEQLANDANAVFGFPAVVKELIRQDNAITAQVGKSPLDSLRRKYSHTFTDTTWTIRSGGTVKNIVFSVMNAGVFRYKLDTFTIRQAALFGYVIRLNNYAGTSDEIILYRVRDYYYTNIDGTIKLKPTLAPNAANKGAIGPPVNDAPIIIQPAYIRSRKKRFKG